MITQIKLSDDDYVYLHIGVDGYSRRDLITRSYEYGFLAGRRSMREAAAVACENLSKSYFKQVGRSIDEALACDACAEGILLIPVVETP